MRNETTKSMFSSTLDGVQTCVSLKHCLSTDHCGISASFCKSHANGGSKTNRSCAQFLGIHIAEKILSKIFNHIEVMPVNNQGYDFICNKGKKIDVKSATICDDRWGFHIRRNAIADYFLCLAFDNRDDLNPIHIWLIPSNVVNYKTNAVVSLSTINKWAAYEIDKLNQAIGCCDIMRGYKQ